MKFQLFFNMFGDITIILEHETIPSLVDGNGK